MFYNFKRAAALLLNTVERELKQRYPSVITSWYHASGANIPEIETKKSVEFQEWVKGLDGIILSVGD